jgi:tetratricopeptide (TPR) repeat protein
LKSSPDFNDAQFLAKYNMEIGENLKSVECYHQAQALGKTRGSDFSFEIFQNTADAAWKGKISFTQVKATADDVLAKKAGDPMAISNVIRIVSNVARKTGNTGSIAKFLQTGIRSTENNGDYRIIESHSIFLADQALYMNHDTLKAIENRKTSLGVGWENNPEKFFNFAKWCLERKINLAEAETFARQAADRASEGKLKASVYSTLAGICEARGKLDDAIRAMQLAAGQDSANEKYTSELDRLTARKKAPEKPR